MNNLENLSNTLQESINNLKNIFEKINENKEQLKSKIQNTFTKVRNELNEREEALLLEVDKYFDDSFFKQDIIKQSEKLPKKIKLSLEKGKIIDKECKINKLSLIINECINIEKNIKNINEIDEKIKICNNFKNNIIFTPEKEELNKFLQNIKNFGKILEYSFFLSSIIINDFNKQKIINDWIIEKTNKNEIKYELIFRMSENGSSNEAFHKYCDNRGPTLVLIKTTKNRIFGGFTPLNWDCKSRDVLDNSNQTFLFSLNLMKKYDIINKSKKAIECNKNYGPYFGDFDFGFQKNLKEGKAFANESCSFVNKNLELTGGKSKSDNEDFETEELEIYKVIF